MEGVPSAVAVARNTEGPRYPIEAVDRALRLLLMFRSQPAVRIRDAAVELECASSTVHRLLAMLVAHGFVTRDPATNAYVPGDVLIDLGMQVINRWDFIEVSRPHMSDMATRFGETVTIGVLRSGYVLYVAEVETDQMVGLRSQLGQRTPAFHSSIGRALLAELPTERIREIYPDPELRNPEYNMVVDRAHLEADLVQIREDGFATNVQPKSLDFISVAVPLHRHGRAVAGLAVAVPSSRADDHWVDRALGELRQTRAAIEKSLDGNREQ